MELGSAGFGGEVDKVVDPILIVAMMELVENCSFEVLGCGKSRRGGAQ